jgi:hypothetical protein
MEHIYNDEYTFSRDELLEILTHVITQNTNGDITDATLSFKDNAVIVSSSNKPIIIT